MLTTGQNTQQFINSAQAQNRYNNQWSAQQAQNQMDYQDRSNAKAMAFSQQEAQKNRDWQEKMSNTSHQRQVADLLKAGLNPILSVNNGASTPVGSSASGVASQGSKGDTDTGMTNLFSGLLQAVIGQATALETTAMTNQTQLQTTQMLNDMSSRVATIGANAMLGTANINSRTNLTLQQQAQAFEEYITKTYPQTVPGSVNALKEKFTDWLKSNGNGKSIGENMSTWLKGRKSGTFYKSGDSW